MEDYGFDTKILHTPYGKNDAHGSLRFPVYNTAAYEFGSSEDLELAFRGMKPAHVYSRSSNPTVEYFERTIAHVTGAMGVIALSSGMAAIANTLLSLASAGDNFITTRHVFGNTYSLFESTLKPFGLTFKYVDLTNLQEVEQAIDGQTRGIFFETITNPQLEVVDIQALSALARKHHILSITDATVTPPNMFSGQTLGVDLEIISSTKYMCGGATAVGGLLLDYGRYDWRHNPRLADDYKRLGPLAFIVKVRREVYRNLGACLSPQNAFLQTLGLETLSLRVNRSCENALELAQWLKQQPGVQQVNYPGLEDSRYHDISRQQFNGLHGGLLTIDLASKQHCYAFMDKLKIFRRATNLNDNKSLILHPASTIFSEYDAETRRCLGVRETMIRVAVGIEQVEDLKRDMEQALKG